MRADWDDARPRAGDIAPPTVPLGTALPNE